MDDGESALPGADLIRTGLAARARGESTIEALLIAIGAPRLRALGVLPADDMPDRAEPEIALYRALGELYPHDTHSRYNALIRRMVSFERALECRRARRV
jgi:hypothetical protein